MGVSFCKKEWLYEYRHPDPEFLLLKDRIAATKKKP